MITPLLSPCKGMWPPKSALNRLCPSIPSMPTPKLTIQQALTYVNPSCNLTDCSMYKGHIMRTQSRKQENLAHVPFCKNADEVVFSFSLSLSLCFVKSRQSALALRHRYPRVNQMFKHQHTHWNARSIKTRARHSSG